MPRMPRIHVLNALYFITSFGDVDRKLFLDDRDYKAYLQLLVEYTESYGIKLIAYILLKDRVQMCVEPKRQDGTVSMLMHDVTSRYTKYYNRRYERNGHLFQSRFRSAIVEKTPNELLNLTAWIHLSQRIYDAEVEWSNYPFSSVAQYMGDSASGNVIKAEVQNEVYQSIDLNARSEQYGSFLRKLTLQNLQVFERRFAKRVVGSASFISRVRSLSKKHSFEKESAFDFKQLSRDFNDEDRAGMSERRPALALANWVVVGFVLLTSSLAVDAPMGLGTDVRTRVQLSKQTMPAKLVQPREVVSRVPGKSVKGLEGSTWEIRLLPKNGASAGLAEKDKILFSGNKISSRVLASTGVRGSNYTVSYESDGTGIWETIQTNENGEVVYWRGEWRDDAMRGVMTRQLGHEVRTYEFVGIFDSYVHPERMEI